MDADVVIAWAHSGFPESAKAAFTRPTRFIVLPNPASWASPLDLYQSPSPIRSIIAQYAPGVTPLRVATLGFSASCQGVAALLSSKDGGFLDAAVAIDGIHVGRPVGLPAMTPWWNLAKLAFLNERLFLITHSSVKPPNFASTTETADWLWSSLTGSLAAFQDPPVPALSIPATSIHVPAGPATGPDRTIAYPVPPAKPPQRRGGLIILGYENRDIPMGTADHIYQAKAVMPAALSAILAARWNAIDPKNPETKACYVGRPRHPLGALMPFRALGQEFKCAKSLVLPADFMTSTSSSPLPSGGSAPAAPASKYSEAKGSSVGTVVALGALALAAFATFQIFGKTPARFAENRSLPSWYQRPTVVMIRATGEYVPAEKYRGWYVLKRCAYSRQILGQYASLSEVETAIRKLPTMRSRECWYAVVSQEEYDQAYGGYGD